MMLKSRYKFANQFHLQPHYTIRDVILVRFFFLASFFTPISILYIRSFHIFLLCISYENIILATNKHLRKCHSILLKAAYKNINLFGFVCYCYCVVNFSLTSSSSSCFFFNFFCMNTNFPKRINFGHLSCLLNGDSDIMIGIHIILYLIQNCQKLST